MMEHCQYRSIRTSAAQVDHGPLNPNELDTALLKQLNQCTFSHNRGEADRTQKIRTGHDQMFMENQFLAELR